MWYRHVSPEQLLFGLFQVSVFSGSSQSFTMASVGGHGGVRSTGVAQTSWLKLISGAVMPGRLAAQGLEQLGRGAVGGNGVTRWQERAKA